MIKFSKRFFPPATHLNSTTSLCSVFGSKCHLWRIFQSSSASIIVDVLATRDSFQPNTDRRANYSLEQSEQVSIEIDTELRIWSTMFRILSSIWLTLFDGNPWRSSNSRQTTYRGWLETICRQCLESTQMHNEISANRECSTHPTLIVEQVSRLKEKQRKIRVFLWPSREPLILTTATLIERDVTAIEIGRQSVPVLEVETRTRDRSLEQGEQMSDVPSEYVLAGQKSHLPVALFLNVPLENQSHGCACN